MATNLDILKSFLSSAICCFNSHFNLFACSLNKSEGSDREIMNSLWSWQHFVHSLLLYISSFLTNAATFSYPKVHSYLNVIYLSNGLSKGILIFNDISKNLILCSFVGKIFFIKNGYHVISRIQWLLATSSYVIKFIIFIIFSFCFGDVANNSFMFIDLFYIPKIYVMNKNIEKKKTKDF